MMTLTCAPTLYVLLETELHRLPMPTQGEIYIVCKYWLHEYCMFD